MTTQAKILSDMIRADYLYNPSAYHKEALPLSDKPLALFQVVDDEDRFGALRRRLEEAEKVGEIKSRFK